MLVTDINYFMEKNLVRKLDLMIDRCTHKSVKRDALLIVEGGEGEGKSTMAVNCGYYVHYKTGREFNNKNIFFSLKELIEFAQSTEEQIIIWDEPGLEGLSTDWYNRTNKDLIRLLMLCRKKRHFFIFCLTKFYKFSDYIVVDRALGLIHVYSSNMTKPGYFFYIRKAKLEKLVETWRKARKRNYKKFRQFRGTFVNMMPKVIDMVAYDKEKDKAIASIGKKEMTEAQLIKLDIKKLKARIGRVTYPINNLTELARKMGIPPTTLRDWSKPQAEIEDKPLEIVV